MYEESKEFQQPQDQSYQYVVREGCFPTKTSLPDQDNYEQPVPEDQDYEVPLESPDYGCGDVCSQQTSLSSLASPRPSVAEVLDPAYEEPTDMILMEPLNDCAYEMPVTARPPIRRSPLSLGTRAVSIESDV